MLRSPVIACAYRLAQAAGQDAVAPGHLIQAALTVDTPTSRRIREACAWSRTAIDDCAQAPEIPFYRSAVDLLEDAVHLVPRAPSLEDVVRAILRVAHWRAEGRAFCERIRLTREMVEDLDE